MEDPKTGIGALAWLGCRRWFQHAVDRLPLKLAALCLVISVSIGGPARAAPAIDSVNAGSAPFSAERPFVAAAVTAFDQPWAIAVFPDGRLLITERGGRLFVVGIKREVAGIPPVTSGLQNGLLDIALSPQFSEKREIYFTFSEPGGGLAVARARLCEEGAALSLDRVEIAWREAKANNGSFWGGVITFDPDGRHFFLAVRDSARLSTDSSGAQDPDRHLGKVLRLNLDGTTPADNPFADAGGIRGQVWTLGHRTAYGLAFGPDGRLWLHEMGPEGGDEFNLLEPGGNYGWPVVSNGNDYGGSPIPHRETRPDFKAPALYWTPIIAPAGLAFYTGDMFPDWRGQALITGLRGQSLVRVSIQADGSARQIDRWDMGARIRDVAIAGDGAVWLIEDGTNVRLLRLSRATECTAGQIPARST